MRIFSSLLTGILLVWVAALGPVSGQEAEHTCDESCQHGAEILANHQVADPAAVAALFGLEEGALIDVQIFEDIIGEAASANEKWKVRWEDGKWKGSSLLDRTNSQF